MHTKLDFKLEACFCFSGYFTLMPFIITFTIRFHAFSGFLGFISLFGQGWLAGWLGFSAMDIVVLLSLARAFVHSTGKYLVDLVEALSFCSVNSSS